MKTSNRRRCISVINIARNWRQKQWAGRLPSPPPLSLSLSAEYCSFCKSQNYCLCIWT